MSKKKRRNRQVSHCSHCDYHHLFFQRRRWNTGYAHKLRNCDYAGAMIPKTTMHKVIHEAVRTVPVPSGGNCRRALEEIERCRAEGLIDPANDTLEDIILFYMNLWFDSEPNTVRALGHQLDVIRKCGG